MSPSISAPASFGGQAGVVPLEPRAFHVLCAGRFNMQAKLVDYQTLARFRLERWEATPHSLTEAISQSAAPSTTTHGGRASSRRRIDAGTDSSPPSSSCRQSQRPGGGGRVCSSR